jgi:hypothetical protein
LRTSLPKVDRGRSARQAGNKRRWEYAPFHRGLMRSRED